MHFFVVFKISRDKTFKRFLSFIHPYSTVTVLYTVNKHFRLTKLMAVNRGLMGTGFWRLPWPSSFLLITSLFTWSEILFLFGCCAEDMAGIRST